MSHSRRSPSPAIFEERRDRSSNRTALHSEVLEEWGLTDSARESVPSLRGRAHPPPPLSERLARLRAAQKVGGDMLTQHLIDALDDLPARMENADRRLCTLLVTESVDVDVEGRLRDRLAEVLWRTAYKLQFEADAGKSQALWWAVRRASSLAGLERCSDELASFLTDRDPPTTHQVVFQAIQSKFHVASPDSSASPQLLRRIDVRTRDYLARCSDSDATAAVAANGVAASVLVNGAQAGALLDEVSLRRDPALLALLVNILSDVVEGRQANGVAPYAAVDRALSKLRAQWGDGS